MIEFENQEVVQEFLDETLSGFDTVENLMIELEKEPDNVELINAIFRPVHSLKGNSAYFGLFKVKKMTHNLENLLDFARKGDLKINADVINILLSGIDYLREMIKRVVNDEEEVVDEEGYNSRLQQIDDVLSAKEKIFSISNLQKNEIINFLTKLSVQGENDFQSRAKSILNYFSSEKKEAKNESESGESIEELKKLGSFFTDPFPIGEATDDEILSMRNLVEQLKSFCISKDAIIHYDELKDTFDTFADSGIGIDEIAQEILLDKLDQVKKYVSQPETQKAGESENELKSEQTSVIEEKPQSSVKEKEKPKSQKHTIRIDEDSLDEFLNYVADLLSVEELFGYTFRDLANIDNKLSSTFKRTMDDFSRISSNLRTSIMDIRKVQAANLLQKSHRIIRDIASKSGKEINLEILGEDLKIDKSYIELLDSPLVHMVRNAADHGIESTEDRKNIGKPEIGNITIDLHEDDKNLMLDIIDDGKGLDLEKLREKAIEKGIIQSNQNLQEQDIINLLFQSGVSTAKEVTDVSGRGVGMDVVKRAIETANGKIKVETLQGKGSKFSIILPQNVSTKINDVYLVKSFSDEIYALPLKLIEEAFTVEYNEIFSVKNKGNVVKRRDHLLSVFVLDEILNKNGKTLKSYYNSQAKVPFVYVNYSRNPIALCIKDVIGVQTIVVKDIDNLEVNRKIFDGGATMGDGKIALLINQDWLYNFVNKPIG